jgi:8-oxo-dGTP pyrophosphatase MutT (NUDIX family)
MYKIYINDTPLLLLNQQEVENFVSFSKKEDFLLARYPGKKKFLSNYVDMLEKSSRFKAVALYSNRYEDMVADFESLFKPLEAAGGVVENEKGDILAIYRLRTWDLPKGKIDAGESREMAALREVEEETGLQQINLGDFLTNTYHTYRNGKGRRILKTTHWFVMKSPEQVLIPQKEENIESAEWLSLDTLLDPSRTMYGSIRDVLEAFRKQK